MSVVTRIRTSQELTVPFPPEEVWAVLADLSAYPDWWPATLGVSILHHPGQLLGAEFEVRPVLGRMFRIRFEELEGTQSMRLRFFGGSLEGPGGFHLRAVDGATRVRYEMDVFARGLDVAVLSQFLPLERIHQLRMRRVLAGLAARLKARRKAAEEQAAIRLAEEEARRRAEQEAAARLAAEEARRRAAEEEAAHRAAEDAATERAEAEEAVRQAAEKAKRPGLSNFDIARLYLEALSSRATPEEIGQFFAPGATHEEFPHRFLATTVRRGFAGILEARSSALARFESQRYELKGATGGGSQVAMEVRWKGLVATTGEGFTAGHELDAGIAVFLKFANGKIVRERTYACFEPWSTRAEKLLTLDERVAQAGQSNQAPLQGPAHVPMEPRRSNFEIARSYLDALEARTDAETLARFYAADALQEELPNRFLQGGAHRDLQAIKLARSRGLALMGSESYELLGATGGGSQVALEVDWSGVVHEGMGLFRAGQRLEARLGIFLKFRDGLIVAQRNYPCAPLEGEWKVSQNQPEANRKGVIAALSRERG